MNKPISAALIVSMLLFVLAPLHAAQKNESDLDFVARMNQQVADMYSNANKLDARLSAMDRKADGKKKRANLAHELNAIKSNLREEQKRLDVKEFKKDHGKKEMEKRIQKLKERLRAAEREIPAQG